ncbi:MAG: nitric oxide reductase subunit [Clostridia bacterium]|nr:nitric oxide reductase subunit [Clostridia bacterium]
MNLSLLWPLLGTMGAAFYFLVEATGVELWEPKLARFIFWFFLAVSGGILISLALGFSEGREYLEALRPFDILLLAGLLLFLVNILGSAVKTGLTRTPVIPILLTGALLSPALYLPTMFFMAAPTVDEALKFLVVHLWEEGSLEILATVILAGILIAAGLPRRRLKNLLLLEAGLVIGTGFLAIGHHYYWIGTPGFWRFLGGVASGLQVIPIFLMAKLSWQHFKQKKKLRLPPSHSLSLNFIYASAFWNLAGAGLFGLLLAIPAFNRYAHGTYLTSAHAHMALFGFFGQLVLGASYFILFRHRQISRRHRRRVTLSWQLLNAGLAVMAAGLIAAGLLQTYLWRVAGLDFTRVTLLLKPYLLARAIGGTCFAAGAALLAWETAKLSWVYTRWAKRA